MCTKLARNIVLALCGVMAAANATSAADQKHFRAELQTVSELVPIGRVEAERCADEPGQEPVIGLLVVRGVGQATLLGRVEDMQSHCVRRDLTFFAGRFTLTNAAHETITGRYSGYLEPAFTGPTPPVGFLIHGKVCIDGGTIDGIDSDCQLGLYQPARGITNLGTGDATILIDESMRRR